MGTSDKGRQQSGKIGFGLLALLFSIVVVIGGCAFINIVNSKVVLDEGLTPVELASSPATSETVVKVGPVTQCGELVLPEPTVVRELPSNIRNILLTDPDKGVILMAEQIADVRKAYLDYRTAVNVAYLEFRRSCKK